MAQDFCTLYQLLPSMECQSYYVANEFGINKVFKNSEDVLPSFSTIFSILACKYNTVHQMSNKPTFSLVFSYIVKVSEYVQRVYKSKNYKINIKVVKSEVGFAFKGLNGLTVKNNIRQFPLKAFRINLRPHCRHCFGGPCYSCLFCQI